MTKREAAIVSAFTGVLIGQMDDLIDYAEEVLDAKGIGPCGLSLLSENLKEMARSDFINISMGLTDGP